MRRGHANSRSLHRVEQARLGRARLPPGRRWAALLRHECVVGSCGAGAMLHTAGDAQMPVLDHSKVEVVLNYRYMLLYVESFGATTIKFASKYVLLVFVCPWHAFWAKLLYS